MFAVRSRWFLMVALSSWLWVACSSPDRAPSVRYAVAEAQTLLEQSMDVAAPGVSYDRSADAARSCAFGAGDAGSVTVITTVVGTDFDSSGAALRIQQLWINSGAPDVRLQQAGTNPPSFTLTAKLRDVNYDAIIDSHVLRIYAWTGCYVLGTPPDVLLLALVSAVSLLAIALGIRAALRARRRRGLPR